MTAFYFGIVLKTIKNGKVRNKFGDPADLPYNNDSRKLSIGFLKTAQR